MAENLYDYIISKIWSPNFPDFNPLDYHVWSVIEKRVNEHSHNTKDSLKDAIVWVMSDMNKKHLFRACNWFWPCIEAVIDTSGGFIE